MMFEKIDKLADKFLDNKKQYKKQFKTEQSSKEPEIPQNKNLRYNEVRDLRKSLKGLKMSSGKGPCLLFNTSFGCKAELI